MVEKCPENCGRKYKLLNGEKNFVGWFCGGKQLTTDADGDSEQIPRCLKPDQKEKEKERPYRGPSGDTDDSI